MGLTIGVLGASGGVGASTLTAALAVRAHAVIDGCDASVAVDLDVRGGLDTTMCLEHLEGLRWPDLELRDWLDGTPSREPAAGDLPGESGLHVLAGTGERLPDPMLVLETVDALGFSADLLAVDCGPRPDDALLSRLDLLVVVARLSAKGAADAAALSRVCPLARTRTVLVTRGPAGDRSGSASARELGVPLLAHLADDPRVPRQAAEGLPPGAVRSGVDGVADEALVMAQSTWLHTMIGRLDDPGRSA
jgi:MinD-like ATPase involved in chromosome partitioning or flagellar assembly